MRTNEDEEIRRIQAYSIHKGRAETEEEERRIGMIFKMHQAYSYLTKDTTDTSHSKPMLSYSTSIDGYFYGTATDKLLDPNGYSRDVRGSNDQGNLGTNEKDNERGDESDTDDNKDLNFRNGDQVLSRYIARQWIKDHKLGFGATHSGKTVVQTRDRGSRSNSRPIITNGNDSAVSNHSSRVTVNGTKLSALDKGPPAEDKMTPITRQQILTVTWLYIWKVDSEQALES